MTQLSLLTAPLPDEETVSLVEIEQPWKIVRRVSKRVYAVLRDSGYLKKSGLTVLTALAFYRNRTQVWPTPAELTRFMFDGVTHVGPRVKTRRRIPKNESRYVAPRLSELIRGSVVRRHGQKVRIGGGVCDQLPVRICRESGQWAHPITIREVGSLERRHA